MRTYKFLLVALIATGVFTACNNDEAVVQPVKQGAEISFRLQGGMPEKITTRSMATTRDNIEAFVVFGTDDKLAVAGDLLFDGVTVARQLDGTFTYFPKKYYSEGAKYAGFFAFSPVSANILSMNIPTSFWNPVPHPGSPIPASFDYTVLTPDSTGNAIQEDLLVAFTDVVPSASDVSLNFEHALSRIFITATNETDDPVIIKELELLNLETTGTFTIDLLATPIMSWTSYAGTLGAYAYVLAPSGVAVPVGTTSNTLVTSVEQGMMVLPQDIVSNNGPDDYTAGDFALRLKYDISNLTDQEMFIYIPDGYKFEKGKQYNINIEFSGSVLLEINFEITVDDFEDAIPIDVN